MIKRLSYIICISCFLTLNCIGQETDTSRYIFTYEIINGDTIPILQLKEFKYKDPEFEKQWRITVYFTRRVYPYSEIIDSIVKEHEANLAELKDTKREKKKVRKSNKKLNKSLSKEYGLEIKNMSVTRGVYLAKMVHRKTGYTIYDLIKKYKTGTHAVFWNMVMKVYGGANLKAEYKPEEDDWMLALVIKDIEEGKINLVSRETQKKALEDSFKNKKKKKTK